MNTQNTRTPFKRTVLSSTLLLALGAGSAAHAAKVNAYLPVFSNYGNFTMLTVQGNLLGPLSGTNDIQFVWDGSLYNSSSDYTGPTRCAITPGAAIGDQPSFGSSNPNGYCNAGLDTFNWQTFFDNYWYAHDIQVFGPGTYSFDVTLGGGAAETGNLTMTVGSNQLGAHMLFDWGAAAATSCGVVNCNIDVAIVWDKNTTFGGLMDTNTQNGSAGNNSSTTFMLASVDTADDDAIESNTIDPPQPRTVGVAGLAMPAGGPFQYFSANFNLKGTLTAINQEASAFVFTDLNGVTRNTTQTSNAIQVTGINQNATITVTGGEYAISTDGGNTYGAWTSTAADPNGSSAVYPTGIANGNHVKVRHTSASGFSTPANTTLTITGTKHDISTGYPVSASRSDTFTTTTEAIDTDPNAFGFGSVLNATASTLYTSATPQTITGINAAANISITGGEYTLDSGTTWTTAAGTVNLNDTVNVRLTSSACAATNSTATLTIGTVQGAYSVTTSGTGSGMLPGAYSFTSATGTNPGATVSSNAVTLSGMTAAADISITGGEYSLDGGTTWSSASAAGAVPANATVQVRRAASATYGATVSTTVNIGESVNGCTGQPNWQSATFSVTTRAADTSPDQFTFTDLSTGINPNATVTSASIPITGILDPTPISIVGGTYDINGSGNFVSTAGTVNNNDTVRVRHTASALFTTSVDTTLTIGDKVDTFTSTTRAADTSITGPITFASLLDQTVNTLVTSGGYTVTGILDPTPISINNGEYEINNSGVWKTLSGTVNNNDTVRVRHTTASGPGTNNVTTLNIGGTVGTFTSITAGTAVSGSNFTMLSPTNGIVGGTNDVVFNWNGSLNTSVASAVENAGICSDQPFFSNKWKAYLVKIYGPGTYTIDTADTMGGPGCPYPDKTTCASGGLYTVTVNAGQVMAHMKFAWSATQGIDVINVWNQNQAFGPSPMYTGAAGSNPTNTTWDLMSGDWDGDGFNGGKMIDGPFVGFSANFNLMKAGTGNTCISGASAQPVAYEVENPPLPKKAWGWCTISTAPVSPMERGDWWVVAGFLGWLAMVRRKLGRTNS